MLGSILDIRLRCCVHSPNQHKMAGNIKNKERLYPLRITHALDFPLLADLAAAPSARAVVVGGAVPQQVA